MLDNLSILVPYFNGGATIGRLLRSIPTRLPILIIDDKSPTPVPLHLIQDFPNARVFHVRNKGYFTGAVNAGMKLCTTDVLILNQDAYLEGDAWQKAIETNRGEYAMIGECIAGQHPAWPAGYIHGTLMFLRRDALVTVGEMNAADYPLWGSTCEYQVRLCRAGFKALPMRPFPGLRHERAGRFGEAITTVLKAEPDKKSLFIRTPPEVSVIVPCYNHGQYLSDLVNSLIGGSTSLGSFPLATFGSFEIVIVNDGSTDKTKHYCNAIQDDMKGIHVVHLKKNVGTAAAINAGVKASHGKYITVLGGDDMREPGSLERLYRAQLSNPHSFVYDQILAFASGQRRPDIKIGVRAFNAKDILLKNHVHAGIMMPRKAWEECSGYPEIMGNGREDWAMNVNLTVHGYCGVFLPEVGYLYRREKQNRTLRNTNRAAWNLFKAKIMQLFPAYYDGTEDIEMCCGQGNQKSASVKGTGNLRTTRIVPGGEGLVVLRYVGKSGGNFTFYGPVTGGQYQAGITRPLVAVDIRDLRNKNNRTPGLLDIRDREKPVFVVEPEAKQAAVAVPPPVKVLTVDATEEIEGDYEVEVKPKAVEVATDLQAVVAKTALQIQAMKLSKHEWSKVAELEATGRKRKGVINFANAQAAG